MEAKDAATSPVSGSSPITASSYNVSETENVIQMSGNTGQKINGSASSGIVNGSYGNISDDDEGFVSGEEDFEASSERPIVADKDEQASVKINSDGPSFGSSEISGPAVEKVAVSEPLLEDDVEKMNKSLVLEGEKDDAEVKSGELVIEGSSGVGDSGDSSSVIGGGAPDADYKAPLLEGLEGKPEVHASVENPESKLDESGGQVQDKTVEGVSDYKAALLEGLEGKPDATASVENLETKLDENGSEVQGSTVEDKVLVGANMDESGGSVTGEEVEEGKVKDDEAGGDEPIDTGKEIKEVAAVAEETSIPCNGTDQMDEPVQSEMVEVEVDGTKVTSKGDAVVEAIDVDVVVPGIAVIGKTAEKEVAVKEEEHAAADRQTVVTTNDSKFTVLEDHVSADNIATDKPSSEPQLGYDVEKAEQLPAEAENGEKFDLGGAVDASDIVNGPEPVEMKNIGVMPKAEVEKLVASETKGNGTADGVVGFEHNGLVDSQSVEPHLHKYAQPISTHEAQEIAEHEAKDEVEEEDDDAEGSISDEDTDGMVFGSSEAGKQFIEELERACASEAENSHDNSQRVDGQIVTDSDEEVDTDEEAEGKELFDSAALAALLKAATGADSDGSSIRISSQDGSRLFSVERPAGLGSSLRSLRPAPQPNRPSIFGPSAVSNIGDADNLSDEEKKKLEKLQQIRVKFLRLVHRLGLSPDETLAAQVLYRLALVAGRQSGQVFSIDAAKRTALQLEAEEKDDLNFSVNILVLGKCGVGKSATINSIFGEEKTLIDAFQPATNAVKEIVGCVDGVKIRVFDTPGLKCSVMEQALNRSILSSVKKVTKKNPPDIVLYVDRLDSQSRDLNDLPLLRTITSSLGPSIWRSAIVTLTHAGSAPPDGPSGSPLSYEVFVSQRSHVVQQSIGHAVGDLRMMSPSLMNPVSIVENHPSCRRNREGNRVLPNGQSWRPQLLLLCYSMKILSEANSLSKPQDPFDHRKLFGFRVRSPPLPYMLSSMLQSRPHPKLSTEQGGDNVDSDIDLDDLSDIEQDEEDEYDQLPAFKPLRKPQVAKLSREQRKAYFAEYDYRVKLLQKKQWKEELRRIKEMKTKEKDAQVDYGFTEEEADPGAAAPVAVPLPDMALPPSFDSDNPAYRYRFLEPTSQFLARPVLDTHGWDHDCGYDGVNVEHNLALASCFPASVTVQITKDKKDFSISLDSSISAKHGENGSSMAGFDIQSIGKQLAYIVRGETKFKNLKKNKTAGGISVTFLGENVVPGVKIEDQITLGKQYVLVGSAGAVRSQNDTAYGANFEVQRREQDFPIGQVQSTFSMSVIRWRGDLALGFNSLAQFSVGRNSKVAVRAGINNKLSGQITVRTSSSEHLSLALAAIIPTAISVYKKLWPSVGDKYSMY
ncbi:hypothetical protein M9H77_11683 [Catharanthus roseus]|uniref:Uncharacterized protein n=1 Tax=Catharanthus roseus TaxID=4058 RepID=A0ACC0BFC3_CATRO|nr:hypothetical protein M9H77_11683 [Catharanthus roseus]